MGLIQGLRGETGTRALVEEPQDGEDRIPPALLQATSDSE